MANQGDNGKPKTHGLLDELLYLLDQDDAQVSVEEIAAEIMRLEGKVAKLRQIKKLLAPASLPSRSGAYGQNNKLSDDAWQKRREIVRDLLAKGPARISDIQKHIGIEGGGSVTKLMKHEWFEKISLGVWALTEAGIQSLEADGE